MLTDKNKYNAYMREYMLNRYHRRRAEAMLRIGGKCVDCGTTENLEFDHVDPTTKEFEISKIWSYSKTKLEYELEKCVLRCSFHHSQKSAIEQSVEHGKGNTGKKNCRCELCRPLKNAYMREWKKRRN